MTRRLMMMIRIVSSFHWFASGWFYFKKVVVYATNVTEEELPELQPFESPTLAVCGTITSLSNAEGTSVRCPTGGVTGRFLVLQMNSTTGDSLLAFCNVAAYECKYVKSENYHIETWKNGRHFADDIVKCIFIREKVCISIKISSTFVRVQFIISRHWII